MTVLASEQSHRTQILSIHGLEHRLGDPRTGECFHIRIDQFILYDREFVAIKGPTGCGKSTLLHLLGLLREPTAVQQFLLAERSDGLLIHHDVRQLWQRRRQAAIEGLRCRNLGFALQRPELIPAFTVRENVEVPLRLNHVPDVKKRVTTLLTALGRPGPEGMPDLIEVGRHRPHQISGGQAQRVALARAVAHRPAVLLADEPTSNLDPKTARRALEFLNELRLREGTAIVMVTHDEVVHHDFADRLVHMDLLTDGIGGIVGDQSASIPLNKDTVDLGEALGGGFHNEPAPDQSNAD